MLFEAMLTAVGMCFYHVFNNPERMVHEGPQPLDLGIGFLKLSFELAGCLVWQFHNAMLSLPESGMCAWGFSGCHL